MTFNGLVVAAAMLLLWLVLCDISEVQAIDERKTEERREALRQAAYARTRRAALMQKNRDTLWQEVSHD